MASKGKGIHDDDTGVPLSESTSDSDSEASDYDANWSNRKGVLIDISRRFQESLKYNKEDVDALDAARQTEERHACVQFDVAVFGVEIQSHRDYPESARKLLWNTFAEIQANADRNINEFRHDGWKWRDATEDDMMVKCGDGELVHPASYSSQKASPKRKGGRKKTRTHRRKDRQYAPVRDRASTRV
jgi:hypothetical protein